MSENLQAKASPLLGAGITKKPLHGGCEPAGLA